jgi:pimeloyl-ACP methyl ester carboxylesterase
LPGHDTAASTVGAPQTFVLVHGAFHGGWCWQRVARRLVAQGHVAYAPSLTGTGDRAHLMSRTLGIETFVTDVTNLIVSEELADVVLVGHSFGGRVIAGVADQMPERLQRLIFVDGALPTSGVSMLDAMAPEIRTARIARAEAFSGGMSVPPPDPARFGLREPEDLEWVGRRMTPHPAGVEASALTLANALGNGLPCTYAHCVDPPFVTVADAAARAKEQPGWRYVELATGHEAMVSAPEAVAELLMTEAGHRSSSDDGAQEDAMWERHPAAGETRAP